MTCTYEYANHDHCHNEAGESGLCFWHDPKMDKRDAFIKDKLQDYLQTSTNMEGFQLAHADLHGIRLMVTGKKDGVNLSYCDLYRADLSGAHLFNINLNHSSLMKADFSDTNINSGDLRNTNMLGTTFLNTKTEHVQWGKEIVQETKAYEALKEKKKKESMDYFEQSEEIYRNLRQVCEARGHFENAGFFFHKEMVMRRFQLSLFSFNRFISKVVDLFCGYGEKPLNVVFFSMSVILSAAVLFFFVGIHTANEEIIFSLEKSLVENIVNFFNSLYFSVVTFTTLGYGDIAPFGIAKAIAAIEAFVGSFTLALFVVVFVKKMTR